jgi:hypothetical protein
MKRIIFIFLASQFLISLSTELFSQNDTYTPELGLTAGAFTNFPANENYLKENISVFYVAPYVRAGRHEFSAGITYPLKTEAIYFTPDNINPRPGAIIGYKFYVFNIYGRENMFIHYAFQCLRFKGSYTEVQGSSQHYDPVEETDLYFNNAIGLGYNLFFDNNARFGFFYFLDYVFSMSAYHNNYGYEDHDWTTNHYWNRISTGIGLSFKLTPLKKQEQKQK